MSATTANPKANPKYLEQLREAIRLDDRDQKTIANSAGIHPVNLSHFMAGRVTLGVRTHARLADVVGGRIEFVIGREEK